MALTRVAAVSGTPCQAAQFNDMQTNVGKELQPKTLAASTSVFTSVAATGFVYWTSGTIYYDGTAYTLTGGNSAADWRDTYVIATLSAATATISSIAKTARLQDETKIEIAFCEPTTAKLRFYTPTFSNVISDIVVDADKSWNSYKITSLATPVADYDASTMKYVNDRTPVVSRRLGYDNTYVIKGWDDGSGTYKTLSNVPYSNVWDIYCTAANGGAVGSGVVSLRVNGTEIFTFTGIASRTIVAHGAQISSTATEWLFTVIAGTTVTTVPVTMGGAGVSTITVYWDRAAAGTNTIALRTLEVFGDY